MNKYRVLIIDDDPHVLNALQDSLDLLGIYETKASDNPKQALDSILDFLPDAILLDQRMPGMTGVEFLEALQSLYNACDGYPVVYGITAEDDGIMEQAAKQGQLGIHRYITKPWPETLFSVDLKIDLRRRAQMRALLAEVESQTSREREVERRLAEARGRLATSEKEQAVSMAGALTVVNLIKHTISNISAGLGGWLYTMDHSIRQISELMTQSGLSTKPVDDLKSIESKLTALSDRVSQCSHLMDIATGRAVEHSQTTFLEDLADTVLSSLPQEACNGHRIVKHYGDTQRVSCSPLTLRFAIYELIVHGLESMKEGGVLTISTGPGENQAVLTIHNTSTGTSPEAISEELFFRETKVKHGLAVAHTIVTERHNGNLNFSVVTPEMVAAGESSGPLGTTVRVELPVV